MFKGLSNLASMMKQASQIGGRMQALTEQLKTQRVTGSAGGGMIEVEVNGLGEMLRLKIDPLLVERGQREMIEDLVPAAVNDAVAKSRQLHMEAMQSISDGFDMPGFEDMMKKFTGGA